MNLNRKKRLKWKSFCRSGTSKHLVAKIYSIEEFKISVLSSLERLLSPKISGGTSHSSFWFKILSLISLILSMKVILSLEK